MKKAEAGSSRMHPQLSVSGSVCISVEAAGVVLSLVCNVYCIICRSVRGELLQDNNSTPLLSRMSVRGVRKLFNSRDKRESPFQELKITL